MSKDSTSTPKTKPLTTLVMTAGGRGGSAKTTDLALVADHLFATGRTCSIIDCDLENTGTPSSFANWFGSKANQLDLRDPEACDMLLRKTAQSGAEFCLCDLPANSSGDLVDWLETVATPELIESLGLRMVTICAINPTAGAAESAVHWMDALGERSAYLVMLSRTGFERRPKPREIAFESWFEWLKQSPQTLPFHTVEVPHLHLPTMTALLGMQKLPSKVIKDPSIDPIVRARIQSWVKPVHAQLEATGLFSPSQQPAAA